MKLEEVPGTSQILHGCCTYFLPNNWYVLVGFVFFYKLYYKYRFEFETYILSLYLVRSKSYTSNLKYYWKINHLINFTPVFTKQLLQLACVCVCVCVCELQYKSFHDNQVSFRLNFFLYWFSLEKKVIHETWIEINFLQPKSSRFLPHFIEAFSANIWMVGIFSTT